MERETIIRLAGIGFGNTEVYHTLVRAVEQKYSMLIKLVGAPNFPSSKDEKSKADNISCEIVAAILGLERYGSPCAKGMLELLLGNVAKGDPRLRKDGKLTMRFKRIRATAARTLQSLSKS